MKQQEDWHRTYDLGTETGAGDPFAAAVRWSRMPMVFADPRQVDTPIVYANAAFCALTGYHLDEIVGRNCRLLQGPQTDRAAVAEIAKAVAERRSIGIDILNYRKDGNTFWNALFISPVFNEAGELLYFFSSQFDASERQRQANALQERKRELENEVGLRTRDLERSLLDLESALKEKTLLVHEIDHRVKNNLQTIATLIAMQMRGLPTGAQRDVLSSLKDRVDALGAVHRRLNNSGIAGAFELSELIRELVPAIVAGYATGKIHLVTELEEIWLDNTRATPVSLIVNELVTNAVRHAWDAGENGTLRVKLTRQQRHAMLTIADDGVGMAQPSPLRATSGLRLTEALVRQVRGTLGWKPLSRGTAVEIGIPVE